MRYRAQQLKPNRAGLTLVEMLIALALSIFIMSILSEAFVKGLEAFGNYKALADLDQRLRTAANMIRRDLRAYHFDGTRKLSECTVSGKPMPVFDGLPAAPFTGVAGQQQVTSFLRQLSQYRFQSPSEGFFSIEEWPNRPGAPARTTAYFEGQDANGRPSYRDQYDVLHFTAKLEGNEPDKFFYGKVVLGTPLDGTGNYRSRYDNSATNGLYSSPAAEMLYFVDNDDTALLPGVGTANGPVQTFNLYRQAWLLAPTGVLGDATNYTAATGTYEQNNDVSAYHQSANQNWFNTMTDVQHSQRRIQRSGGTPPYLPRTLPATTIRDGSDILMTNVISFDVKVFDPFAYKIPLGCIGGGPASGRGAYVDIGDVSTLGGTFTPTAAAQVGDILIPVFGATVDTAPALPPGVPDIGLFDTGTARYEGGVGTNDFTPVMTPATHQFPITSIQITIRVYEPKSRQTRQITIIQEM